MKTASCKAKGRNLQKYVADFICRHFPTLKAGDVVWTSMGAPGVDIKLSPAAKQLFPFSIECKAQEKVAIWAAWKQTIANCQPETDPLLVIKRNREQPLVVMDFETFVSIMSL